MSLSARIPSAQRSHAHRFVLRASRQPGLGFACAIALLAATPTHAGEGILEINQTCAVQTGCFSGDTPGLPITIDGTAGSSYRLTSRLVVPDANTTAISIGTSEISIDLNNFSIVRAGCEGATSTCKPTSGSGDGINGQGGIASRGASVRNGSVIGMGGRGILLGDQAEVVGVRVRWNRQEGILVGQNSRISRSSAFENGSLLSYPGMSTGQGSTVTDCVVQGSAATGLLAEDASTVEGSAASSNAGDGIDAEDGSNVSNSAAYDNGFRGIKGGLGSTILGSASLGNGDDGIFVAAGAGVLDNAASGNQSDGIETTAGGAVSGNALRANTSYGLKLGSDSAYRLNVLSSSGFGTIDGGVNLFSNVCDGSTSCP